MSGTVSVGTLEVTVPLSMAFSRSFKVTLAANTTVVYMGNTTTAPSGEPRFVCVFLFIQYLLYIKTSMQLRKRFGVQLLSENLFKLRHWAVLVATGPSRWGREGEEPAAFSQTTNSDFTR